MVKATFATIAAAPRTIELGQRELTPLEGQVLVRVIACGICRGDLYVYERATPEATPLLGRPFGHEWVGDVVAVGPRVRTLSEGDRVVGSAVGGFANAIAVDEAAAYRAPRELGEAACMAEPLKCVTTVVRAAVPDLGDTVVVFGCGFMGLAAIAWLSGGWQRALIAVDPVAARRALALRVGASHAVDPTGGSLRDQIRDLNDGRDADVAIEFAGSPTAAAVAASCLRPRGTLAIGGGHTPGRNVYFNAVTIHHVPPQFCLSEADEYRRTIDAMARGRFPLDLLVTHRFKLSEIESAFETAARGAAVGYLKGIVMNDFGP